MEFHWQQTHVERNPYEQSRPPNTRRQGRPRAMQYRIKCSTYCNYSTPCTTTTTTTSIKLTIDTSSEWFKWFHFVFLFNFRVQLVQSVQQIVLSVGDSNSKPATYPVTSRPERGASSSVWDVQLILLLLLCPVSLLFDIVNTARERQRTDYD